MATYVPYTWTDRQSEYPTRRILTWVDQETQQTMTLEVTVTRSEGTVTVEGDPFAAVVMNGLESRINAGFATCSDILLSENDPTAADGKNGDIFIKVEVEDNTTSVVAEYVKVSGSWIEMPTGSGGSTVFLGTTDPSSSLGEDGNLYVKYHLNVSDNPVVDAFFVKITGAWAGISTGAGYLELTQAQYDALTPAQQTNGTMYLITDTNGDNDQFQPVVYSTSEREIGVWTDGKPLYEKTIYVPTVNLSSDTKQVIEASFVGNNIISYTGYNISTGGPIYSIPDGRFRVFIESGDLKITAINGGTWNGSAYVTVTYTKTTDTAGAGTWTPQGVPAVHYSTNEQVVGTWIDGSTIYEKTVYNAGGVSGSIQIPHGISNLDKVISYEGFCYDDPAQSQYANGQYFPLPRISADDNNIGISGVDSTYVLFTNPTAFQTRLTNIYVTIRYTKST